MSETKSNSKRMVDKTEEMSRKIWLAGLGAYGQSFDNLHTGYEKMSDHAREYFEELVGRGEKLETDTRSGVTSARSKIREQAEKNRDLLNRQITELREKVSSTSLYKDELVEELQGRVAKLTETLNKLIPTREKPAATKKASTAKKKPATKKASTATKKTATKKAANAGAAGRAKAGTGPTAVKQPAARKTAPKEAPGTKESTTTTQTDTQAAS